MVLDMIKRIKLALKDSETVSPKHGVVLSQSDTKRVLYRLHKEVKTDSSELGAIEDALKTRYSEPVVKRLLTMIVKEGRRNG